MALSHPEIPTCDDCQTWVYDREWRRGERREYGNATPCRRCPKGKLDARPHPEKDLSDRNWQAWMHYQECRAVNHFPDDPIVRRNAAIIRAAEDSAARSMEGGMLGLLSVVAAKAGG